MGNALTRLRKGGSQSTKSKTSSHCDKGKSSRVCIGLQKLSQPYFRDSQNKIKEPHHLIKFWRIIFSYLGPSQHDSLNLRWSCLLFRDSLPASNRIRFAEFPTKKYDNLRIFLKNVNTFVKVIFIKPGVHIIPLDKDQSNRITIRTAREFYGENEKTTIIHGGFRIRGGNKCQEVIFQNLTVSNSTDDGIYAWKGMNVRVNDCIIEKAMWNGIGSTSSLVTVENTIIRFNQKSGILCQTQHDEQEKGLVIVKGKETKIYGNCVKKDHGDACYGLECWKYSTISLDAPLVLNEVSSKTQGSGSFGGEGKLTEMRYGNNSQGETKDSNKFLDYYTLNQAINEIKSLEGNDYCADCGQQDRVNWVSLSHGITLCIRCAGTHRSFGVDISCVRSLTLDFWTEFQIRHMLFGGNTKFQKYMVMDTDWTLPNASNKQRYNSAMCQSYRELLKQKCLRGFRKGEKEEEMVSKVASIKMLNCLSHSDSPPEKEKEEKK
jgi:hypothetical protein